MKTLIFGTSLLLVVISMTNGKPVEDLTETAVSDTEKVVSVLAPENTGEKSVVVVSAPEVSVDSALLDLALPQEINPFASIYYAVHYYFFPGGILIAEEGTEEPTEEELHKIVGTENVVPASDPIKVTAKLDSNALSESEKQILSVLFF